MAIIPINIAGIIYVEFFCNLSELYCVFLVTSKNGFSFTLHLYNVSHKPRILWATGYIPWVTFRDSLHINSDESEHTRVLCRILRSWLWQIFQQQ